MKKAKVMLTALVVFAALGTTLAFKARSNDRIYIDTNSDGISDTFITGKILVASTDPDAQPTVATNTLNVAVVETFFKETGN